MNFFAHETAEINKSAQIGKGSQIWHYCQVRERAVIGEHVTLSRGVYIDVDVKIADNVKIQNYVSIYKGVCIEEGAFIGPYVCFTNDIKPRSINPDGTKKVGTDWEVIPTLIKKGASLGTNATVMCGVTIGEWAMIGAGAVVTKNVPPHALMLGSPARVCGYVCFCGETMSLASDGSYHCECGRSLNLAVLDR